MTDTTTTPAPTWAMPATRWLSFAVEWQRAYLTSPGRLTILTPARELVRCHSLSTELLSSKSPVEVAPNGGAHLVMTVADGCHDMAVVTDVTQTRRHGRAVLGSKPVSLPVELDGAVGEVLNAKPKVWRGGHHVIDDQPVWLCQVRFERPVAAQHGHPLDVLEVQVLAPAPPREVDQLRWRPWRRYGTYGWAWQVKP